MMKRPRARFRALAGAAVAAALIWPALMAPVSAAVAGCGPSTVHATIERQADGSLRCGSGEAHQTLDDLADPRPGREAVRSGVTSFVAIADPSVVDEESPLRAEFLDKCADLPTNRTFRPQEAFLPALTNAHVDAINRLAATGTPALNDTYDFVLGLGSATDNRQRNELRWFVELMDGTALLDPDSGGEGYEGVQGADPSGAGNLASPVPNTSLLDLANEPFTAYGLHAGPAPLPWYSVIGSRDVRAFGALPTDPRVDGAMDAWATGPIKINDVGPQHLDRLCKDPSKALDPATIADLAARPGTARTVTPDPDRSLLTVPAWIDEHASTSGAPTGHGLNGTRCTDASGRALDRACYTWDQGSVTFLALDTAPPDGIARASIDAEQFAWLARTLEERSTIAYDGEEVITAAVPRRIFVVIQHHSTAELDAQALPDEDARTGADLRALLLDHPGVVLHLTTGRNRVQSHSNPIHDTGYWEVETAPLSAWPSQTRSIEIADNHDGTLSLISTMIDAAVPADPRTIDWRGDDPTDERLAGADDAVNEAWLASAAREIAANDQQRIADAAGTETDRNVEMVVANPLGVTSGGPTLPTLPTLPGGLPATPALPDFALPDFNDFQPPIPPAATPGGFAAPQPRVLTGPGLAVRPTSAGGWGGKAVRLFSLASLAGLWLAGGRVRRWMVGI